MIKKPQQKFVLPPPLLEATPEGLDALQGMSVAEVILTSYYATTCLMLGNQKLVDATFKTREPQLLQGVANTIELLKLTGHLAR